MSDKLDNEALTMRLVSIVEQAREHVSRSVNTAMVQAYWLMGREIVESDQAGRTRADYGEALMRAVAKNLQSQFGRGFSYSNVKRMRQFYVTYPQGSPAIADEKGATSSSLLPPIQKGATLSRLFTKESTRFPSAMSWSHYCLLMRINAKPARSFYEIEAVQSAWSVRELERQIGSMLYERLAKSRDEAAVKALSRRGLIIEKPADAIKDPMVLEFLGLEERTHWHERDLEQAIIDRLETFLLELGKGFCFVGRQKRLTVDGDHFYVDLVFYNRLLRCFILIELLCDRAHNSSVAATQMWPSSLWRCWIGDIALVRGNFITHKYFDQRTPSRTICHVQGDRACHQQRQQQHQIEGTALSSSGNRNIVHLLVFLSLQHRMESKCNIGTHKFNVANLFPY